MTGTEAYFISPEGVLIPVETSHIEMVVQQSSKFDLTKYQVEDCYRRHNEPLGVEGGARNEILAGLIGRGWVHIRRYPSYWLIQAQELDNRIQGFLRSFAEQAIGGSWPFPGKVLETEVMRITLIQDGKILDLTFADVLSDEDFTENVEKLKKSFASVDIYNYRPERSARRPRIKTSSKEKVLELLRRTSLRRRKRVLLYLSSGTEVHERYENLPFDLVILSDFAFDGFEVRDRKVVLMACWNNDTIEYLRQAGVKVNCVITRDCGCNEGGNTGCENSPERFEKLAPVLADNCLYTFDHVTLGLQPMPGSHDLNWFTGFTAELADAASIKAIEPVAGELCRVVRLKRLAPVD